MTTHTIARRAGAVLAGAVLTLGIAATSATASPVDGKPPATTQASCFAARADVPFYSWPDYRDHGRVTYLGKVGQGQGLYWEGNTIVYRIGTLWGGPAGIYMNC